MEFIPYIYIYINIEGEEKRVKKKSNIELNKKWRRLEWRSNFVTELTIMIVIGAIITNNKDHNHENVVNCFWDAVSGGRLITLQHPE